jgi:peptidoglycan/LPS O-acetylase OafA/YrhL
MLGGTCLGRMDRGQMSRRVAWGYVGGLSAVLALIVVRDWTGAIGEARVAGFLAFLSFRSLHRLPWPRAMLHFGRISYSFYLLHLPVAYAIGKVGPNWLTLAIWIGVSLVLAELCFRYVEAPAEALGRRLTQRKAEAPVRAEVATAAP